LKGCGNAYGAVSIVNAISTGRGAALGVMLKTEAEVELADHGETSLTINGVRSDPELAVEVVKVFAEYLGLEFMGCRVTTSSEIPMAVGLKSSSSAAVAIARAYLDAVGKTLPAETILNLVAEASIRSHTSITGALDDAAACMLGGVVVTDNLARKILLHEKLGEILAAAIYVPPGKTYTREFRKELLTPVRELVEEAHRLALNRQYWKAMTLNGLLHSAALGLPTAPAIEALRAGALAAGLSGTGPAVAAICHDDVLERVVEAFGRFEGRVLTCSVNRGVNVL
jgi:shikimate kinase